MMMVQEGAILQAQTRFDEMIGLACPASATNRGIDQEERDLLERLPAAASVHSSIGSSAMSPIIGSKTSCVPEASS